MSESLHNLLAVMARLRDPDNGCPWDIEQNFATIAPFTLEEAHEVADAIAREDWQNLEEELGDLLLQVVFHARMAEEKSLFNFEDVARGIVDKMIRRHPHVFPEGNLNGSVSRISSREVLANWDAIKQEEKKEKGIGQQRILADVPAGLPALLRAEKLQRKAGKVGFDWNNPYAVIAKLREELDELEAELQQMDKKAMEAELGDVLFCMVNLARHLGLDSDMALRQTNAKFERRFAFVEDAIANQGLRFDQVSLDEMEKHWQAAKQKGL